MVDCEDIYPESLGEPVRCNKIVFLHSSLTDRVAEAEQVVRKSLVVVNKLDDQCLRTIKAINGVLDLTIKEHKGMAIIALSSTNTTTVLAGVEAACKEHGVLLLYMRKQVDKRPTFEGPATISPISKREGVLGLLKQLQVGYASQMMQQSFNDNPTRLLMELTSVVGPADCYKLSVGPLDEMAGHLCTLMELEKPRNS